MKILLFGKNGQVGWELQRSLAPLGELIALSSSDTEHCGNLADLSGVRQTIRNLAPDIIVNAAAYTAVDKAETAAESALAHRLNAEAPGVMAQEAKNGDALLIHYSTDYVFDGAGNQAFVETDQPSPLNVYGQSKLAGEKAIIDSGCAHFIFRTSWVYATYGSNFIKTILRLMPQKNELTIVDDQIGSPTGAELIADVSAHALRLYRHNPEYSGIYHLAASQYTSWYEYAQFIRTCAQRIHPSEAVATCKILPIASAEFRLPAQRPLNSRLNTSKIEKNFDLTLPSWQSGVTRTLHEIFKKP